MKIEKITVYQISKPLDEPLQNSLYTLYSAEHVFCKIEAEGLSGIGEALCFHKDQAAAIHTYIDSMKELLLGKDAELTQRHWKNLYTIMGGVGHTGLPIMALAAVDTALWDLLAKSLNTPVWKMLGAWRTEIPLYASGGWLIPVEKLVQEALGYKEQGYNKYKMKLGCKDWHEDMARVKAVIDACGPDFEVMVDVNQGWDVKRCLRAAKVLEEMGVTYLEEPVHAIDFESSKFVRDHVNIDVVAGESLFSFREHAQLMLGGCVDYLNPDLGRCGGVQGFMNVAAIAQACNIPISSHVYTSQSVHLMAAAPTGTHAEVIPGWWSGIFDVDFKAENSVHKLTDRSGFGTELSEKALKDYCVGTTVHTL